MKNKILAIMFSGISIFTITACAKEEQINERQNTLAEHFSWGTTLDDGRHIHFALEVPYLENEKYDLMDAFLYNEITPEDFVKKLEYLDILKDGGSKIYKYNKVKKEFGDEDFYVISCNSTDNIKDMYIAKYRETLENKCSLKIDDLEGVSMSIREGTLTKKGATIIITDTSNRENIYGEFYAIQKHENNGWINLEPINDMAFNSIGYQVDKNNTLELKVDWEYYYGKLEKGTYRILKNTSEPGEATEHYITAEFTIE